MGKVSEPVGREIVLHTADFTRNRNGFERMQETVFRGWFGLDIGDAAGGGIIVAGRREPTLDCQLDVAWLGGSDLETNCSLGTSAKRNVWTL